ncbi:MAG: HD domain-containing protein [Proteobacteria bacterium]|nr:HD domain-containing protein [Pseudomonadota bacterium]
MDNIKDASSQVTTNSYKKLIVSMRYWLLGRNYTRAVDAMELALEHHIGLRKDEVTPEFQHQLEIAHFIRTLPLENNMENCLIVAFLHDLPEDYDYSLEKIREQFGTSVRDAVWLVTKEYEGMKKDNKKYYEQIAENGIASIVKGVDRIHNIQSMQGVFTETKQKLYIQEVKDHMCLMLKVARRKFPIYEPAYENIKYVLSWQIQLIKHIHGWK